MVIGMVIKTDGKNDNDTQEVKIEKKDLNIKQYGIKRKYKLDHKFKCKLCAEKLSSIQEFNQHYLDNHPPLPCPDCTCVFISPWTLAKHRYMHADYMYECADCSHGFIFKNPIVKFTLKWLALCALSQNAANASRGNWSWMLTWLYMTKGI